MGGGGGGLDRIFALDLADVETHTDRGIHIKKKIEVKQLALSVRQDDCKT